MKEWRKKNKERIKKYNQEYFPRYYIRHEKRIKAQVKEYSHEHPHTRTRQEAIAQYHRIKERLFTVIGSICSNCLENNVDRLEAHHFNHDGPVDRQRFPNIVTMYRYYSNHPYEALQKLKPLCKKCHRSYHWKLRKEQR